MPSRLGARQAVPTCAHRAQPRQSSGLLHEMCGIHLLMARLLYESGMRLMECFRKYLKVLDFEYRQIAVRDAKGAHDRYSLLPASLVESLHDYLIQVKKTRAEDLSKGYGGLTTFYVSREKSECKSGMDLAVGFSI